LCENTAIEKKYFILGTFFFKGKGKILKYPNSKQKPYYITIESKMQDGTRIADTALNEILRQKMGW
jgi:hypothetical protein